jgi:hypothetical protein
MKFVIVNFQNMIKYNIENGKIKTPPHSEFITIILSPGKLLHFLILTQSAAYYYYYGKLTPDQIFTPGSLDAGALPATGKSAVDPAGNDGANGGSLKST